MAKHPKRPKDSAALAKLVVDIASGVVPNDPLPVATDVRAVRRGEARAKALSPKQRSAIAKQAAEARWKRGH